MLPQLQSLVLNYNQVTDAGLKELAALKQLQARRCGASGKRLRKTAEVDHRVPLYRVWREHRDTDWPRLLGFWGVPNLQVINRDAHAAKCAVEANDRRIPNSAP